MERRTPASLNEVKLQVKAIVGGGDNGVQYSLWISVEFAFHWQQSAPAGPAAGARLRGLVKGSPQ